MTDFSEAVPAPSARPVLAVPVRRAAVVVAATAAAAVLSLALRYRDLAGAGRFDAWAGAQIQALAGAHRGPLRDLVPFGGPRGVMAVSALVLSISLVLDRPRLAVVALVGPAATGLATTFLQPAIGRTLHGLDGFFALPSGHTAGATASALLLSLLAMNLRPQRARLVGLLCAVGVTGAAVAIAVALVVNDLHYATDTVAGFLTAVALVLGTALAVDAVAEHRGGTPRSQAPSRPG